MSVQSATWPVRKLAEGWFTSDCCTLRCSAVPGGTVRRRKATERTTSGVKET